MVMKACDHKYIGLITNNYPYISGKKGKVK